MDLDLAQTVWAWANPTIKDCAGALTGSVEVP
jgi:hypothetical protein